MSHTSKKVREDLYEILEKETKRVTDTININIPRTGSRWKNRVDGQIYTVLIITNKGTKDPDKYPITVVYVGANGKLWSEPAGVDWWGSFEFIGDNL